MWLIFKTRMLNLKHVVGIAFNDKAKEITFFMIGGAAPYRQMYDIANYLKVKVLLEKYIKKEGDYEEVGG